MAVPSQSQSVLGCLSVSLSSQPCSLACCWPECLLQGQEAYDRSRVGRDSSAGCLHMTVPVYLVQHAITNQSPTMLMLTLELQDAHDCCTACQAHNCHDHQVTHTPKPNTDQLEVMVTVHDVNPCEVDNPVACTTAVSAKCVRHAKPLECHSAAQAVVRWASEEQARAI